MAEGKSQAPFRFEREMTISILEKQDVAALQALKQFLLNMPGPKAIETVLAQAVCDCAEERPEAFNWVVAHAAQLEPELWLEQWAGGLVTNALEQEGCVLGREFRFDPQPDSHKLQLHLEASARQILLERCSKGEWLLLNRLFGVE